MSNKKMSEGDALVTFPYRGIADLAEVYNTGLYKNVYKDKTTGVIIVSEKWYSSPNEAQDKIMWHEKSMEYLYTAQVTSGIHKFEKP